MQNLNFEEIKEFLDEKVELFNQPNFIENDPISIPHQFTQKEDVEMHKNETPTGANSRAESDGTIIMLQQELQGANDAINELKLALRMALLEKAEPSETRLDPRSDSTDQYHGQTQNKHSFCFDHSTQ